MEAKFVTLALIKYRSPGDREDTVQLAIVGDNNVQLLDTRAIGFGDRFAPKGLANKWLADKIFAALKKASK